MSRLAVLETNNVATIIYDHTVVVVDVAFVVVAFYGCRRGSCLGSCCGTLLLWNIVVAVVVFESDHLSLLSKRNCPRGDWYYTELHLCY